MYKEMSKELLSFLKSSPSAFHAVEMMKEELLKEYNNGVINEKINSIYNLIDNIYDKTIDYKNTNNISLIDTYLNEMRFNLEVLNVLIEIA